MREIGRRLHVPRRIALLAAACLACGCARTLAHEPLELRAEAARRTGLAPDDIPVPFAVDGASVDRARSLVPRSASGDARARALAAALLAPEGFGLRYRPATTTTGAEVLAQGEGNCFALSSAFIGIARQLGLDAYYLDASEQIQDLTETDDFVVSSGHVSAVVRAGSGTSLIDFDGELSRYQRHRILDDVQALAHFYNNRGYELLLTATREGRTLPWEKARADFAAATRLHPGLGRAWNNLGIAEARLARVREAEIAYHMAIVQDPSLSEPHSNLGVLELAQGRVQPALRAFERAAAMAPRNPYHHYHRGVALAAARQIGPAIAALERALELKPDHAASRAKLNELREAVDSESARSK